MSFFYRVYILALYTLSTRRFNNAYLNNVPLPVFISHTSWSWMPWIETHKRRLEKEGFEEGQHFKFHLSYSCLFKRFFSRFNLIKKNWSVKLHTNTGTVSNVYCILTYSVYIWTFNVFFILLRSLGLYIYLTNSNGIWDYAE